MVWQEMQSRTGTIIQILFLIDDPVRIGFTATSEFDSCFPAKPLTINRNRIFIGLLYKLGI